MIQLRGIALYGPDGERRTIDLRPGQLNVITGESATGKSALLEIVEFCLGRTRVSLPEGVLTRTVEWYGVLVDADGEAAVIARPGPQEGQATVSGAYLALGGPGLTFPDRAELEANTNADGINEYLTRLTGIGDYEHVPPAGATRLPLTPTVSHALFYCFQRQYEIANAQQLFHRQDEEFIPQAIKDTFPYFLGAVDRDAPVLRGRLALLRRDLRRAEQELERARQVQVSAPTRSVALISEAADLGMVTHPDEAGPDEIRRLLVEASEIPEEEVEDEPGLGEYQRLAQLSKELTGRLRALAERAEALKVVGSDQAEYATELREQAARMESLHLLPAASAGESTTEPADDHSHHCPVCGSAIEEADATVEQLAETAAEIRVELDATAAVEPARQEALTELEAKIAELRQRLREVHEALAALSRDRSRVQQFRDRATARAYVKGKIVQHLEELAQVEERPLTDLEANVESLSQRVEELEGRLDPEAERQNVISRLNVISNDMTDWAGELHLEHAGGRVRIDPFALTVVVDAVDGPIPLSRMGSAANWIGYHLVAHLALHKWFVERSRPVPRFLMLDQPTQAWYPSDVPDPGMAELADSDRQAVEAVFSLINNVVQSLTPGLQVIVTDHAHLTNDWFQAAIVEEWRSGQKLIPANWIEGT